MVTASDIGWGAYRNYEGPFYRGKAAGKYVLPDMPTDDDRVVNVISSTEGGNYMAINMYDRAICSSGIIQWIEAGQYSVSAMLGNVAEHSRDLIGSVDALCADEGLEFKKNHRGRWRFFFDDDRGEVDRKAEQQQQFLLNSSGKKGDWDVSSRAYAKRWAAAISSVWENEEAQRIQALYTSQRLMGFCLPYARMVLNNAPLTPVGRALRASYLSFAANNPTWANQALHYAIEEKKAVPYTPEGFVEILKQLTFYKGITIYPHRYDAIRPVLERLYGLDLPDFATELRVWKVEHGFETLWDTLEVQEALVYLGYDLGPWGADGKWGNKTTEALLQFEQLNDVPIEYQDGKMDIHTARKLETVMAEKGRVELRH